MKTRSSLGFALLLLVPGCSSSGAGLSDPNQPPAPLGQISGELKTLPLDVAPGAPLRIELAWFAAGAATDQPRIVGQDIPVTAKLPAGFTLPLSGPPPAAALWTSANYPSTGTLGWTVWQTVAPTADQSFAVAQIVAYEDLNGNGALDMVGVDATSAPDRIIDGYPGFVLYATNGYGTDAFLPSGASKDGYGVLTPNVTSTNAPYNQWSSVASTSLSLFDAPADWNLLMCTNFNPLIESNAFEVNLASSTDPLLSAPIGIMSLRYAPVATPDVVFPPANQPLLRCTAGGTQYCISACPAPQSQFYVCQTDNTPQDPTDASSHFYCEGRFFADPACYTMPTSEPAGWPCTYTPDVDCTPDPTLDRCADAGVPPIVGDDAGVASDAAAGD